MRSSLALLLALDLLARPVAAQIAPAPTSNTPRPTPAPATAPSSTSALDRLTQSNHELLDLLKKQQSVLEDMQYDRRLQSRQIQSLEERLEETLQQNAQLQAKIAKLEATPPPAPAPSTNAAAATTPPPTKPATPPPPSTHLPPPEPQGAPGYQSWRRLFAISGTDAGKTELFHIQGRRWRVLWHNQDKSGDVYLNTSALFISAFPQNDPIPQKVCSKLGTGGDSTELKGPGTFYLKIEASGGSWELAVEDFH